MKVDFATKFVMLLSMGNGILGCDSDSIYCSTWKINANKTVSSAPFLDNVITDIESVEMGDDFVKVHTSGIPSFTTQITEEIYDALVNRPTASSDFANGAPSVQIGDYVEWGTSVGYTGDHGCSETNGYWPEGPECPSDQDWTFVLPTNPEKATERCFTSGGAVGAYFNGVAMFSWTDGSSYNSEGIWHNLAAKFEVYDLDINQGHAQQQGQYHFHLTSTLLSQNFNSDGSEKSTIWGFAADGYPILGPYVEAGVEAQSCWKTRDYDDVTKGGCGTGKRTCLLKNPWDLSEGTYETSSTGPDLDTTVTTMSKQSISAASGIYFEDYYYDSNCTEQGDQYLDQYNGREDATYGYVYHLTSSFPYNVIEFAGKLPTSSSGILTKCYDSPTSGLPGSSSSSSSSSQRTSTGSSSSFSSSSQRTSTGSSSSSSSSIQRTSATTAQYSSQTEPLILTQRNTNRNKNQNTMRRSSLRGR